MPVPVPRQTRPIAHPVFKSNNSSLSQTNKTLDVTGSLSVQPLRPPLSFGSREEWPSSLPSWRRNKQRLSSDEVGLPARQLQAQDFYLGLTAAGNAPVIKGTNAQASFPPMYNLFSGLRRAPEENNSVPNQYSGQGDGCDEMSIDYNMNEALRDMQWELVGRDVIDAIGEDQPNTFNSNPFPIKEVTNSATLKNRSYLSGEFTPVYEDRSPGSGSGPDSGSSPLEPVTPFGDFVDRAVADVQHFAENHRYTDHGVTSDLRQHDTQCNPDAYQAAPVFPSIADVPKVKDDAISDTVAPTVNVGYKKLVEPLSEWVANYVWKICTMGYSLPAAFAQTS